ncbi:adenylate/guanylate cyclase domain-containing protein [bacterium]|nr:adenylate/guanylate cyclase domain-containing protein [bacterium]
MDLDESAHSLIPELHHEPKQGKTGLRWGLGLAWLVGLMCLAGAFNFVANFFDTAQRFNQLVIHDKVLPLREWKLRAYKCDSFYAPTDECKEVKLDLGQGRFVKSMRVQVPLSADLRKRISAMQEKPTLLSLTHTLNPEEFEWLSVRTTQSNKEWPSQAQLVALGSVECESKSAGGNDFDPSLEPEKLACYTQSRFEAVNEIPANKKIQYFIAIGQNGEIGPARWPLMLAENQHMHELMSLDHLTLSSVVLWNLVSLLMPIFVIAFRFVFRGQKTLNTLADYAICLVLYAACVVLIQQANLLTPTAQTLLCAICVLLEGVVLTLLVRYAYCTSSGESWSTLATTAISIFFALIFIAASTANKQTPQRFLLESHQWRDSLGSGIAVAALCIGFYIRYRKAVVLGHVAESGYQQTSDDYGTGSYVARLFCVAIPLIIFGMSNYRELINPSQRVLKWEDMFFLPSQAAVAAFFLGIRANSSLKYGRSMKARLEMIFSGVLNLQRSTTPIDAVESTVAAIRDVLPAVADSPVEFIEHKKWSTDQFQNHIALSYETLYIPLHGSKSYRGILKFDYARLNSLSEEEEHTLSTLANALAINLETQEAASELEKMHQASLRFVPRDFLRLLNSESLVDFNLGDHVEMQMSIMFADIRNFTQISEGMTPSQNFDFINGFLTQIAPIIKHHGGFIDKYIGDAIMALFPDSPVKAARCAVDMQIALRSFNDKWLGLINQEIRIGVGIHYGPMVLGIVGYAERLSSTVMSDAVNLASRLESLTKQFQVDIIVSEDVLQHMTAQESGEFNTRMLDSVRVKGRNALVTIYEVVVPTETLEELKKVS